jgi:hypothetical protein
MTMFGIRLASPRFVGAAALLVVTACTSPLAPEIQEPGIQVGGSEYMLTTSGRWMATEIPYVFTNRTGARVYVVNCQGGFGVALERWEDGKWKAAWSPVLASCLSPPILIEAGEQYAGVLNVVGALPGTNAAPRFDVADPSGVYRLVWTAALSSFRDEVPFGELIPLAARTSNTFVLRLE